MKHMPFAFLMPACLQTSCVVTVCGAARAAVWFLRPCGPGLLVSVLPAFMFLRRRR
ncbi:MAG TPA: hypothetical protein VF611_04590 [Pyrinomonadaceae bacterium]